MPALEDADESKVLLLVEKKKLLQELRTRLDQQKREQPSQESSQRLARLQEEVYTLCREVQEKEDSLNQRLQRQKTKWMLRQQLEQAVHSLTQLETMVKDLSASTNTLASSGGSSSLSSLASSLASSLNSVSMTDIYRSSGPLAGANSVGQLNTILEAISLRSSESLDAGPPAVPPPSAAQQRRARNHEYVNLQEGKAAMTSAASEESVTGDSGVFEARHER